MSKSKPNDDIREHVPSVGKEHFSALLGKNPLPVFIFDVETGDPEEYTFLAANEAACDQYGYSEGELKKMKMLDLHPEEDIGEVLEDVAPSKDSKYGEYSSTRPGRYVKKDGSIIYVDITSNRINYEGRQARVAIARNVTERVQARKSLRESEERYRMLVERNHAGVTLVQDDKLIFVSERFAEILGYEVDEIVGMNPMEFLDAEDVAVAEETMRHRQAGLEVPESYSLRAFRKDGELRILEIIGSLVTWKGKPASLGSVIDVTEQRAAENELRKSQAHLKATLESAPFDMFALDTDGRYVFHSHTIRDSWGDIIGKKPEDLDVDDITLELWLDNNRRAMAGETVEDEVEFEVRGENRRFYNVISPIRDDDTFYGILGINLDITERMRAEEALKKAKEDLERKNKEMEAFVYTAAHDLRTPLISVRGFLGLMKKQLEGRLDEKSEFYMERVMKNAEHFDNLLGDLLEFSQVGVDTGQREEINLSALAREIASEVARSYDIEASLAISEELPIVNMQSSRVYQLLENLINNSVKFKRSEIPLELEIGIVPGEDDIPDGHVSVYVRDNGVGIDEDIHGEIFGLFSRPAANSEEGTGVGLAIVRRIVEEEGGSIRVESTPGEGTTFYFSLPAVKA